eukprot:7333545-Pyramimonas_sp.AAC.1
MSAVIHFILNVLRANIIRNSGQSDINRLPRCSPHRALRPRPEPSLLIACLDLATYSSRAAESPADLSHTSASAMGASAPKMSREREI